MTIEDRVNEAIINCVTVTDSSNSVRNEYGDNIYKIIYDILQYGVNDTTWAGEDECLNHKITQDRLAAKYPYLTRASKIKIADVAAYFWKPDDR